MLPPWPQLGVNSPFSVTPKDQIVAYIPSYFSTSLSLSLYIYILWNNLYNIMSPSYHHYVPNAIKSPWFNHPFQFMLRWSWKVWKDNSCGQPSQRHWQSSWFLSISLLESTFIKWDDDFEGFLAYILFWMLGSHLFFSKKDPSAAEATCSNPKYCLDMLMFLNM